MSMPFYVAPEQVMKDRADYARKGIARGRALTAVLFDDGIAIVAENPRNTLRKVSEIYDRIALRRRRQLQRVRSAAGGRRARRRHQGLPVQPRATSTPAASPTSTPRSSGRSSPTR